MTESTVPAEGVQEDDADAGEGKEGVHFYRDGKGVQNGAKSPPPMLVGEEGEEEEELVECIVKETEDVYGVEALREN